MRTPSLSRSDLFPCAALLPGRWLKRAAAGPSQRQRPPHSPLLSPPTTDHRSCRRRTRSAQTSRTRCLISCSLIKSGSPVPRTGLLFCQPVLQLRLARNWAPALLRLELTSTCTQPPICLAYSIQRCSTHHDWPCLWALEFLITIPASLKSPCRTSTPTINVCTSRPACCSRLHH